uniref:Uncharacterized protein n=1 Tax=Craspedostauros australis TaxID=1486917 RepID=A0A7S0F6N2_9STRA
MPQQRLVGIMRMIESQNVALLEHHALDEEYIRQSNTVLHNRRGKHRLENGQVPPSLVAFLDHIGHRRFVCFLFVQEPYSGHSLTLRRRVADDAFQQSVAVILVQNAKGGGLRSSAAQNSSNTSNSNDMENNSGAGSAAANLSPEARAYRNGTGFAVMRSSNILYTLLNVTYIPMIVVVDMRTGRPCSKDAGLALEWNTAGDVVRAWEKGRSGLTMAQKFLAVCTFQSECIIL